MINEHDIDAAEKQGWVVRFDYGKWKIWSGPWGSMKRAREIIDKHIRPKRPDEMLVVVGTQVFRNPQADNWSYAPDYSELPDQ